MMRPHAKLLWIVVLIAALVLPAHAESLQTAGRQITAGIIVVAVLVTAIVVVVVVHHGKTRVTGCVSGTAGGFAIVSESDQRVYELSGAAAGLKAGERVTIDGKRHRNGSFWSLEVSHLRQDFGRCRP
jgi:hypothetical protein